MSTVDPNRRRFTRIPMGNQDVQVSIGGHVQVATLINESINGIRLGNLHFLALPEGKKVSVLRDGDEFVGLCRTISREEDGFAIGLERENPCDDRPPSSAMLLNCFLEQENMSLICIPVQVKPDDKIRVRLWNGHEMDVDRNMLTSKTRQERYEQIRRAFNVNTIMELYGLPKNPRLNSSVDVVFDFEYGYLAKCPTTSRNLVNS